MMTRMRAALAGAPVLMTRMGTAPVGARVTAGAIAAAAAAAPLAMDMGTVGTGLTGKRQPAIFVLAARRTEMHRQTAGTVPSPPTFYFPLILFPWNFSRVGHRRGYHRVE